MSAGTKIFLAVAALFIGGVVIYYGVITPPQEPTFHRDDTAATEQADDDRAAEAPAEFHNALPGDAVRRNTPPQQRARSTTELARNDNQPDSTPLARDEPTPSWSAPRPRLQLNGTAVSDGGKDTPDYEFVGPPIPVDYSARTVAANTPISTEPDSTNDLYEQRIAAATRRPQNAPALSSTSTLSTTPSRKYTDYTVRPGDTLVYIAEDWFGDPEKWDLIVDANPDLTNPNRLRVGQVLKLPAKDTVRVFDAEQRRSPGSSYTVRSGDTLSAIAWKQYGQGSRWREIYDANRRLIGNDPSRLKVGMKLVIP